jgi:hypothetical protein
LQDEEAEEGGEVDGAQQGGHQPAEQLEVGVGDLRRGWGVGGVGGSSSNAGWAGRWAVCAGAAAAPGQACAAARQPQSSHS